MIELELIFDPTIGRRLHEILDPDGVDHSPIRRRHDRSHQMVVQLPAVTHRTPHHLRPQEVTFIMSATPITFHDSDPNFTAEFKPVDAKGQPTSPDSIPVWSTSDATVIQVSSQTPDGLIATVSIVGAEGGATLAVTTTDTNGTVVKATQDYTIVAGEAVSGTIVTTPGIGVPTAADVAATVPVAVDAPVVDAPAVDSTPVAPVADPAAAASPTPTTSDSVPTV